MSDVETYVSAAHAEAHVRATLDRPDQVHVIRPEVLRALLDEIRGLRLRGLAADGPSVARRLLLAGPGGDDAEVWIPPLTDCMDYRHLPPCPRCGSTVFHDRPGRCGDCGRRPSPPPQQVPSVSDAGCPVGECGHPGASHEAADHAADGTPLRPICCAGGCRCGEQWRTK